MGRGAETMMRQRMTKHCAATVLGLALLVSLSACGPSSVMLHSQTGEPLIIQQSAYTASGCEANLAEEANRLGMSLQSTDVKGSLFGDTLMWPFVKGYVCIGTEQPIPRGVVGRSSLYQG